MSLSWPDVKNMLELRARYLFGIWVFGALLIFVPSEIKLQMGITIPGVVRPWLGFFTLASFVLWLVLILLEAISFVRKKIQEREVRSEILSQLQTLSTGERDIFIHCLANNQRTIQRNITDGPANSLKQKRLLVMASQGHILAMAHTIPKFVWDHIKKNDAVLFPELYDEEAMKKYLSRRQNRWMR